MYFLLFSYKLIIYEKGSTHKVWGRAQFRDNYQYKGIDIAMKYTQSWGFHLELEKIIHDISEKEKAEEEIRAVAIELGSEIMSVEEVKIYTEKMDSGHNYGEYTEEEYPYK